MTQMQSYYMHSLKHVYVLYEIEHPEYCHSVNYGRWTSWKPDFTMWHGRGKHTYLLKQLKSILQDKPWLLQPVCSLYLTRWWAMLLEKNSLLNSGTDSVLIDLTVSLMRNRGTESQSRPVFHLISVYFLPVYSARATGIKRKDFLSK